MSKAIGTGKCPFHSMDGIKDFDMLDKHARSDPWPYYDWLRDDQERRVFKLTHEETFYVLHQHEDVKAAFTNSEQFGNGIIPSKEQLFIALMDGAEHRRVRKTLSAFFAPKVVESMKDDVQTIVESVLNVTVKEKQVELLKELAVPIPMKVLAHMLGLTTDDAMSNKLYEAALKINRALFVTGGTGPRRSSQPKTREKFGITMALLKSTPKMFRLSKIVGITGIRELVRKITSIDHEMEVPRPNFDAIPDAISALLELLILMGNQIDEHDDKNSGPWLKVREAIQNDETSKLEMILATSFILFAGHETSISIISNSIVHLAKHPETFAQLKNEPTKVPHFIEECLRYYTPVGRFLRRVKSDIKIGETTIPKNAIVILMPGAANTDPRKFENACAFDLNRKNTSQHLSFGKGLHFCLGAQLARMMIQTTLTELLRRVERISIDDDVPQKFVTDRDNGVFRYDTIGLTFTAGTSA